MRVNPNPMPDLLAALNQSQLETQQVKLEISTGRSVNQPSDNPTAAALLVENNDQATFNAGDLQSLSAIQGQLSTADSTMSSVVTAVQRAISLGVEGANGTLSDGDRAAIATELQGIQSQLVSLANASYEGRFIFAGTDSGTPPFVVDNTVSGRRQLCWQRRCQSGIDRQWIQARRQPAWVATVFGFRQRCFPRHQRPDPGLAD